MTLCPIDKQGIRDCHVEVQSRPKKNNLSKSIEICVMSIVRYDQYCRSKVLLRDGSKNKLNSKP